MGIFDELGISKYATGELEAEKPGFCLFSNLWAACILLGKHIGSDKKIAMHCDIDTDGVGSGYILNKFLQTMGMAHNLVFMINKEREHGITEKYCSALNDKGIAELVVVLDSSSSNIDVLKKFHCDVLVIDHHLMSQEAIETNGRFSTEDGHDVVILNNTNIFDGDSYGNSAIGQLLKSKGIVDIEKYTVEEKMSCGLVLYEVLRVYCEGIGASGLMEHLQLYQWAGVTLFSDVISLDTPRNQWYISNTAFTPNVEAGLSEMLLGINKYNTIASKSSILFSISPFINCAMRAGHSSEALEIILNNRSKIGSLSAYKEEQIEAIEAIRPFCVEHETYITADATVPAVKPGYFGTAASKIKEATYKNVYVYTRTDAGKLKGSFRGRQPETDYRSKVCEEGAIGEGHKVAFGLEIEAKELDRVMESLASIEENGTKKYKVTVGNVDVSKRGMCHIDDFIAFRKAGDLMRLAVANARLSSEGQVLLYFDLASVRLVDTKGKLFIYEVEGIECKAFEPINTPMVALYVEFQKTIELYLRNEQ